MKKVMKRVITACLAFAMILALVTPASVEAATKNESLTLYKGETYTWYLTGVKSLSSASSTKKAVATVKANKSKKQYTISAKKAGTSVVTIKGKDYYGHTQSLKIKVTVAEPKFDLKLQKLDGNYILIRVKNNTKATFDRLAVRYSLKNSSGSDVQRHRRRPETNQSNPTGDIPSLRDSGQLADRNSGYGSRPLPGRILSPGRCQSFIFRRRITPGTRQSAGDAKSLRSQSFYHGRSDRDGRLKSRSDL